MSYAGCPKNGGTPGGAKNFSAQCKKSPAAVQWVYVALKMNQP